MSGPTTWARHNLPTQSLYCLIKMTFSPNIVNIVWKAKISFACWSMVNFNNSHLWKNILMLHQKDYVEVSPKTGVSLKLGLEASPTTRLSILYDYATTSTLSTWFTAVNYCIFDKWNLSIFSRITILWSQQVSNQ